MVQTDPVEIIAIEALEAADDRSSALGNPMLLLKLLKVRVRARRCTDPRDASRDCPRHSRACAASSDSMGGHTLGRSAEAHIPSHPITSQSSSGDVQRKSAVWFRQVSRGAHSKLQKYDAAAASFNCGKIDSSKGAKLMPLKQVVQMISDIYASKIAADALADKNSLPRPLLPAFTVNFFTQK
jgi:hypothetical protein